MNLFLRLMGGRVNQAIAVLAGVVFGVLTWAPQAYAWNNKTVGLLVIASDSGGDVVSYAIRVSHAKRRNTKVEFRGKCQSACTLFLSLPTDQVCITPGASFSFHKAHSASADMNAWGTQYLLKTYPAWVVDWIEKKGGLSRNLLHMSYDYAARHLPPCTGNQIPRQYTALQYGTYRELR